MYGLGLSDFLKCGVTSTVITGTMLAAAYCDRGKENMLSINETVTVFGLSYLATCGIAILLRYSFYRSMRSIGAWHIVPAPRLDHDKILAAVQRNPAQGG